MSKLKAWIAAARLRTLPLSVSGIIVGSALANAYFFNSFIFWLAIIVTIGFQDLRLLSLEEEVGEEQLK